MLAEALESINRQSHDRIEVVVVDDSTDSVPRSRVAEILGNVERVVVRRGPGEGAAAARNIGIRVATGDYLAFLDDDDRWLESKVEQQVALLREAGPEVGVVYTGQRAVDGRGRTLDLRTPRTRGDVTEALLRGAKMTPFSAVLVRASLIDEVGLLDEQLPVWEDLDWYIRLSRHCRVESIPAPLTIRRMGDHDQLTDRFETIRDVAFPRFVAKHRALAASFGPDCERAMVASRLLDVAHASLETGRYREALRLLTGVIRRTPRSGRAYLYLLAALAGPVSYRPLRWCRRLVHRLLPIRP
jgi:glycosyltransferase involved in cell wall biosynthesis